MNSEQILPGMKVWIDGVPCGFRGRVLAVVERRTRTLIVVRCEVPGAPLRYSRATGFAIGNRLTRIAGVATETAIAASEIACAAHAARERELYAETCKLRKVAEAQMVKIERTGHFYSIQARRMTAAEVRAVVATLDGVRG